MGVNDIEVFVVFKTVTRLEFGEQLEDSSTSGELSFPACPQ